MAVLEKTGLPVIMVRAQSTKKFKISDSLKKETTMHAQSIKKLILIRTLTICCGLLYAFSVTGDAYKRKTDYHEYSQHTGRDTAVVIVGYNRLHYFRRVIDALQANPESQELPFFFILDGGHEAQQEAYTALIKASPIKHKHVIRQPSNFGLHKNVIWGLRFMFDWCGFKRIIHFEDDVVVTPNYLRLLLSLDSWAHATYDNIGAVQAFRPCNMSLREKRTNLSVVGETAGLLLGYCIHKRVWDDIKDIVYEYEKKFLVNKHPDSKKVKPWMYKKLAAGPLVKTAHIPPSTLVYTQGYLLLSVTRNGSWPMWNFDHELLFKRLFSSYDAGKSCPYYRQNRDLL